AAEREDKRAGEIDDQEERFHQTSLRPTAGANIPPSTERRSDARSTRWRRQPGPRGDDQCFYARLQGRMNRRKKARVVVGGELIEPARLLRLRIRLGIGPTDEPEYRGGMPFGAESAYVQLDDRLAGDDVLLGPGLQRADGDDRGLGRGELA